jgi:hypothetical protein
MGELRTEYFNGLATNKVPVEKKDRNKSQQKKKGRKLYEEYTSKLNEVGAP